MAGLLAVTAAACSDEHAPPRAGDSASAGALASAGSTASGPQPVQSRTVDAAGDILEMSVGPLVRSGDAVVLTVQTRLQRSANGVASAVSRHFSTLLTNSFDAARLIDEGGRRVYLV